METTANTDVLIIGAGPTGLSLACQLIRYNIDFIILDKNAGVTPFSKALGVHARTLEIYEQLGLVQTAIKRGAIAGKVRFMEGGEIRGEANLSDIGHGMSPYPYMLVLEQSKNEQLLYEYLQTHNQEVLWNAELENFSQNDTGVNARIKTSAGQSQTIEAKFLVGCDGAKSRVRQTLGLTFEGSTFERTFYVADVQIDWQLSHDALHVCFARDTFVLFFPMQGDKRYRIVGVFPEGAEKEEGDVLYEDIEAHVKQDTELALDISNVNWFSTYKVHTRRVNQFSLGRCFVAGDAAHIHSPAGAQGMNTGIQDAYNLAWKLAFVVKGYADAKLLNTYNEERLENAQRLLETTDRAFQLGAGKDWLFGFIRTRVFPPLANFILSFDAVKKTIFPLLSQIGINYRDCALSDHRSDEAFEIKAGDRMPYFLVDGKNAYDLLRQAKFHLLIFSDGQSDYDTIDAELENDYGEMIEVNVIPLYPQIAEIFGADKSFMALLRPDNYIGLLSPEISLSELRDYFNEFLEHS
jgi:2-polyprenyl-6-methoxyphenol hydroxylase-like FAD-dependent oxidoreductase